MKHAAHFRYIKVLGAIRQSKILCVFSVFLMSLLIWHDISESLQRIRIWPEKQQAFEKVLLHEKGKVYSNRTFWYVLY